MSVFEQPVGERVSLVLNGQSVEGVVTEVETNTASDEWPEAGETVTFKAVGGEVEKTVREVEPDAEHPIIVDGGRRYERSDFVEYTEQQTRRVVELSDGRELWPPEDGDGE